MNFKLFLTAATAASILASCAKVSDATPIFGTVVPEGLDNVNIIVPDQIDTLVPVVDGKFQVEIPTNLYALATASSGECIVNFIPDGTKLTVVLDNISTVKSSSPKISVQDKFNTFYNKQEELGNELATKRNEIMSDQSLNDDEKVNAYNEFYEKQIELFTDLCKQTLEENHDNILSVLALDNLRYEMTDQEVNDAIASISPQLQDHSYVKAMKQSVTARLETAEGNHFKDFTVETVVGMTRSVPPQPKYSTVKFSDYVGNGKYVLVDFWSPWCGPCKREMPNIKAIYEKYKGKNFDVLSVAVWERQGPEVTINTAAELGMTWNQINNAGSVPTEIYGIDGIPHIMLIGPDGTILHRGLYGEAIEEAVSKYIKK